jgi:hypothetical protein
VSQPDRPHIPGEDAFHLGIAWRHFLRVGARLRGGATVARERPRTGPMVLPIMLLAHEHDPDPAKRPKPLSPDKREASARFIATSSRIGDRARVLLRSNLDAQRGGWGPSRRRQAGEPTA